ncbi:hypothetical protein BJ165DRAFT_1451971 [Panaeolus papilionaceus]|nr:hypothetical protein BJ165DRAFT_1451971 [Panaeolus papilionaceus]
MATNMQRYSGVPLDYLFDSIGGPMPSRSFNFNERQHQISQVKAQIIAKALSIPQSSTSFEVLMPLVYHPLRPVTLQVLFEIINGKMTPQEACDANVVGALRHSLRATSRHTMDTKAHEVLHKLANALLNRARDFSDKDNIEEAICYYQYLAPVTPRETPQYLEIVLGLCTAYHFRHQLLRMSEDFEQLIHFLNIQNTLDYETIFNSLSDSIKACQ